VQRGQLRDIADAHQVNTGIGNAGACFIGEGLKFNNSLLELRLVRIFIFVCCDCIEVRSFDHLISRVFFLQSNNVIGDHGAGGLGDGLKMNSIMQQLYLVGSFSFCLFW
jgi:hypothetical protein